jgi:hypothetical protein
MKSRIITSVRALALFALFVLFGPLVLADEKGDPSEKAGWSKLPAGPKARYAFQTVWDSHKQRILLFGGETNPEFKIWDALWSFSPEKGEWTELKPEGKRPARRAYHAACFDTKRNGIWLHGGFNPDFLDDLWFFDSEKETWKEVVVKGAKPSPRDGHDLYYNPKTDQLLLLGGLLDFAKFELSDELWIYDIGKNSWSKKTSGPSARILYCGCLDVKGQRLFICGGFGKGGEGVSGELWTYDIAKDRWDQAKEKRPNFAAGRMVFVSEPDRLLIFGGADTNTEVWYDLKTAKWSAADKPAPAPARSYHAMCQDPKSRRVYVLGGTTKGFAGKNVDPELWLLKLPPANPAERER